MSRDVNLFLEDMQMACEKVIRYVKDLKQEQFLKDEKTYDAVGAFLRQCLNSKINYTTSCHLVEIKN